MLPSVAIIETALEDVVKVIDDKPGPAKFVQRVHALQPCQDKALTHGLVLS